MTTGDDPRYGATPPPPEDPPLATLTPLMGIPLKTGARRRGRHRDEPPLWYVTITVSGERMRADVVREGMERLSIAHGFLASARYASSRAEIRYWDESPDIEGTVALALRMWAEHQHTAGLPDWKVVGLEVVDRDTARRRWEEPPRAQVGELGEISPLSDW